MFDFLLQVSFLLLRLCTQIIRKYKCANSLCNHTELSTELSMLIGPFKMILCGNNGFFLPLIINKYKFRSALKLTLIFGSPSVCQPFTLNCKLLQSRYFKVFVDDEYSKYFCDQRAIEYVILLKPEVNVFYRFVSTFLDRRYCLLNLDLTEVRTSIVF